MDIQTTVTRFNEIYGATNKKVLAFITAKCNSLDDVDDVFQETYYELFSTLKKRGTDFIQNDEAFVMRIARLKTYRHYSLIKRLSRFVSSTAAGEDGTENDLTDLEQDTFNVEDSVISGLLVEDIEQSLQKRPEDIQKIFMLYYSLNQTIPEIAALLGTSESNIKNKLYRTLKELRNLYQ
jgi:RNA polymerase sigma-70 factor (ECF subfamily)